MHTVQRLSDKQLKLSLACLISMHFCHFRNHIQTTLLVSSSMVITLSMPFFVTYMSHLMTKPTKWHVRPAKTQISLGICPVWSESWLSAWRKLGPLATHWAHSEDSDQTGRMPRLIWVFAGHILTLLVLSCRGSYIVCLVWFVFSSSWYHWYYWGLLCHRFIILWLCRSSKGRL